MSVMKIYVIVILPAIALLLYELISNVSIIKENIETKYHVIDSKAQENNNFRLYIVSATSVSFILGSLLGIITITESGIERKGLLIILTSLFVLLIKLWADKNFLRIVKLVPAVGHFTIFNGVISYLVVIFVFFMFRIEIWQLYAVTAIILLFDIFFTLKNLKPYISKQP